MLKQFLLITIMSFVLFSVLLVAVFGTGALAFWIMSLLDIDRYSLTGLFLYMATYLVVFSLGNAAVVCYSDSVFRALNRIKL